MNVAMCRPPFKKVIEISYDPAAVMTTCFFGFPTSGEPLRLTWVTWEASPGPRRVLATDGFPSTHERNDAITPSLMFGTVAMASPGH
jgi:hypothetical protein